MYENLIKALRNVSEYDSGYAKLMYDAADTIEAQDRHILTLQREMMAEAESHIAEVNRLNKQIEVLSKTENNTRWIPVTERLPEKHEWVLVRSKFVKMKTDFINNDGSWHITPGVTHWTPLPEPPKEET